jgi:hypothetical protein
MEGEALPQSERQIPPGVKVPASLDQPSRFRIFISYSHEDEPLVNEIAAILAKNDLEPMYDRNFAFGQGFHDQIRNFIASAHVFLPVLTETADQRKWVHQEIGYSMALNIPVLPVAVGKLPGEMLHQIHAIRVQRDHLEPLRVHLSRDKIEALIERYSEPGLALHVCADFADLRAELMARYANDVAALGYRDVVRQKGGLSSFHIPVETIRHPVWQQRYGKVNRSYEHCRLQRGERLALSKHAEIAGCKLIINPALKFKQYHDTARLVRLQCLSRFLEGMSSDRCQVATSENMEHSESVTILGTWFAAESVHAELGKGYRQTTFTRHAPTIMEKIANFDAEFDELLSRHNGSRTDSRREALVVLEQEIAALQRKITAPQGRKQASWNRHHA